MPTSTGATFSKMRLRPVIQAGFTLLEIMVVVMLMGLLTVVLVSQGNWTSDGRQLEQETARLQDTLALLNERSLFSGQLMALRLETIGWTPLAYDRVEGNSCPWMTPRSRLTGYRHPWNWSGNWMSSVKIRPASVMWPRAWSKTTSWPAQATTWSTRKRAMKTARRKRISPRYFFPSGEVSPMTLTLRAYDDVDAEQRLRMSALGQFSDPDAGNDEEAAP